VVEAQTRSQFRVISGPKMSAFTLLSGVRNRKVAATSMPDTREEAAGKGVQSLLLVYTHCFISSFV